MTSAPRGNDTVRFAAELTRTVIVVVALAYVIRAFVMQPFVVEGLSMFPRFRTNDFLIVDKLSYRLHAPERGDIIVFQYPNDTTLNYVKRVIGLPGERVRIADGKVTVINPAHPQGFTLIEPYLSDGNVTAAPGAAGKEEYAVPEGDLFVLGDNRRASSDSREWGFLDEKFMIGRAVLQAWPFDRASVVAHARYDG